MLMTIMVALIAVVISFLLFRPVAAAFAAGELNNRVALLFFLHAIGGAGILLGTFLLVKARQEPIFLPLLAAAVGWTAPSIALAFITRRKLKRNKTAKKEETGDA